jgi:hypothetical protein
LHKNGFNKQDLWGLICGARVTVLSGVVELRQSRVGAFVGRLWSQAQGSGSTSS